MVPVMGEHPRNNFNGRPEGGAFEACWHVLPSRWDGHHATGATQLKVGQRAVCPVPRESVADHSGWQVLDETISLPAGRSTWNNLISCTIRIVLLAIWGVSIAKAIDHIFISWFVGRFVAEFQLSGTSRSNEAKYSISLCYEITNCIWHRD